MDSKQWWQSKTIWFAVLFGIVQVAGLIGFGAYNPDANTNEIIGVVVSVVMIVLRMGTSQAIK